MKERSFQAENSQLTAFRDALQAVLQGDLIEENILYYALDSTAETVEQALSTYDNRQEDLLDTHQRIDDEDRRYFTDPDTGVQIRLQPRVGYEVEIPKGWEHDKGQEIPEDAEYEWTPVAKVNYPISQLAYQFESDEDEEAFNEAMNELADVERSATLFLVEEETFLTAEQIDVAALRDRGLYRIVRQLIVDGNQDWLDRDEDE